MHHVFGIESDREGGWKIIERWTDAQGEVGQRVHWRGQDRVILAQIVQGIQLGISAAQFNGSRNVSAVVE